MPKGQRKPVLVPLKQLQVDLLNSPANKSHKPGVIPYHSNMLWVRQITPFPMVFLPRITDNQACMLVKLALVQLLPMDKVHHRCMERWGSLCTTLPCSNLYVFS